MVREYDALRQGLAGRVMTMTPGHDYLRRGDAEVRPRSPGRAAGSVTLPTRPVTTGGSHDASAFGPGPLFLPAPHPKGEVAGPGAGPELGQLSFELRHFGLEGLDGRGLSLEWVDLTAQSGQFSLAIRRSWPSRRPLLPPRF